MTDLENVLERLTKNLLDVAPQLIVPSDYVGEFDGDIGVPVISTPLGLLESLTEDRVI